MAARQHRRPESWNALRWMAIEILFNFLHMFTRRFMCLFMRRLSIIMLRENERWTSPMRNPAFICFHTNRPFFPVFDHLKECSSRESGINVNINRLGPCLDRWFKALRSVQFTFPPWLDTQHVRLPKALRRLEVSVPRPFACLATGLHSSPDVVPTWAPRPQ